MPNPTDQQRDSYYSRALELDEDLSDALAAIRAEEDEHRITPQAAAAERVGLMERHLAECARLRTELLGGTA